MRFIIESQDKLIATGRSYEQVVESMRRQTRTDTRSLRAFMEHTAQFAANYTGESIAYNDPKAFILDLEQAGLLTRCAKSDALDRSE